MTGLRVFIPITKVDAAKRLVYGTLAEEVPDKADEILDYATSKPFFEKWSGEFAKATNGKSVGNLRAMHSAVAAGKFTQMEFVDDAKRIDVCAKVVDDDEWKKVEEGVYTGFSVGGKYVKRWADGDLKRYTCEPLEGSLVDNPCIPTATFTMVKADGMSEERHFKGAESGGGAADGGTAAAAQGAAAVAPTGSGAAAATAAAAAPAAPEPDANAVATKAAELAKAAGKPDTAWADFIEPARAALMKAAAPSAPAPQAAVEEQPTNVDPRGEVEQGWRARDGKFFAKKADALAHNATLAPQGPGAGLTEALGGLKGALAKAEGRAPDAAAAGQDGADSGASTDAQAPKAEKVATLGALRKGLYEVGEGARVLASLSYLLQSSRYEAETEGDDSTVPARLLEGLMVIGEAIKEMAIEEIDELIAMFDKAGDAGAEKMAKAIEKDPALKSANWQKMHDKCVKMGADCSGKPGGDAADKGAAAGTDAVSKVIVLERENADLRKVVDEATVLVKDAVKRIEALEAQPMPPKSQTIHAVDKGQDGLDRVATMLEKMRTEDPQALSTLLIKAAQTMPQIIFPRPVPQQ